MKIFYSVPRLIAVSLALLLISASAFSQCLHPSSVLTVLDTPSSVAVGDFDGDDKPDLATANTGSNTVSVLLNLGNDTFADAVYYLVGSYTISVVVGDFNGDGKPDLATANKYSDNISVLLNIGDGTFSNAVSYSLGVGTFPQSIAVGDFNGDSKLDLVTANETSNNVSVLFGTGTGTFAEAVSYGTGERPYAVAVGDFNGDTKADLAVANYKNANVSVLLNAGDGTFTAGTTYGCGSSPSSVAVGDFNGDDKADLVVANSFSANVSVLLGHGDGTFATAVNYGAGTSPNSTAVSDINGDGKADLAVANISSNNVSLLFGQGDGTFATAVNYAVGEKPYSVATGDFNNDTRPDLAFANRSHNVSVLLNLLDCPAPTLTANVPGLLPGIITVLPNTPSVTLAISGCAGGSTWTGSNSTSGTGTIISVPTSTTGTIVYSATCLGANPGSPASFSVIVTPAPVTGSFDGFVNGADCGSFRGWAWDRNKINTAVFIEILDGPNVLATLPASDFRQDLIDAGKGNGQHGFRFVIPESIKDGVVHRLSARVAESSFILKDSPRALICTDNTSAGNQPPQPPTPTVLNAPLTALVGVPFSGTLVPFTDPENTALTYTLSGLPDGLEAFPVGSSAARPRRKGHLW